MRDDRRREATTKNFTSHRPSVVRTLNGCEAEGVKGVSKRKGKGGEGKGRQSLQGASWGGRCGEREGGAAREGGRKGHNVPYGITMCGGSNGIRHRWMRKDLLSLSQVHTFRDCPAALRSSPLSPRLGHRCARIHCQQCSMQLPCSYPVPGIPSPHSTGIIRKCAGRNSCHADILNPRSTPQACRDILADTIIKREVDFIMQLPCSYSSPFHWCADSPPPRHYHRNEKH